MQGGEGPGGAGEDGCRMGGGLVLQTQLDGPVRGEAYTHNNNNKRLVTLAEHTSDHGKQTNSSTKERGSSGTRSLSYGTTVIVIRSYGNGNMG